MPWFTATKGEVLVRFDDRRPAGCIHSMGSSYRTFAMKPSQIREELADGRIQVLRGQRFRVIKRLRAGERYYHGWQKDVKGERVEIPWWDSKE